jgi:hypothetical protein
MARRIWSIRGFHTPPERFEEYMTYLHDEGFKAISVRDLAKYVDWRQKPIDPWKIIEERKGRLRVAF